MKDAIILIDNLKEWLYVKDGSYENRRQWREDLISQLNSIRYTIASYEKKHNVEVIANATITKEEENETQTT